MDTKPSYPLAYFMSNHCHVLELQEVPSKYSQQDINFRKLWHFECYLGTASICTLNYYSIKGFYCFLFIKSRVKRLRNFLCKFKQKIVKYVLLLRFFSCSHCMGLKNTIFVFYVTQKSSHAVPAEPTNWFDFFKLLDCTRHDMLTRRKLRLWDKRFRLKTTD